MKRNKLTILLTAVILAGSFSTIVPLQPHEPTVVQAGRRLKRFPKSYRGTWYYKHHKVKVYKYRIQGGGIGRFHCHFVIRRSGKGLKFSLPGGQPARVRLTHRHGHKCLVLALTIFDHYNCYRSKKVARHYRNH